MKSHRNSLDDIYLASYVEPLTRVWCDVCAPWLKFDKSCRTCTNVRMSAMVSQITSPAVVYSTVYSGADQGNHQSSESLAFVRGIHRWPVNSPHRWPVTRKMIPFDNVIMVSGYITQYKSPHHHISPWDCNKMVPTLQTTFQMHFCTVAH